MLRFEWLGLAVLVTLTVWSRAPAPPPERHITACPVETHEIRERRMQLVDEMRTSVQSAIRAADRHYRAGDPARAAQTLRDRGFTTFDHPLGDPELQSLAELYTSFDEATQIIAATRTSTVDRFVALRRAQALDIALGGAFADRLNAQMREVAPAAAIEYARVNDRIGAELANHTAALFR
jgi:hypothetical protein